MEQVDDHEAEPALVRPFLSRLRPDVVAHGSTPDEPEAAAVRSYAMTSGRSTAAVHLEFESMLQVTPAGIEAAPRLTFERATIVRLCRDEVLSVAELSARLRIPIGVVRVVAADLIVENLLEAFMPSLAVSEDVDLITRLIEGVRAL